MPDTFQGSFIPKKQTPISTKRKGSPVDIFYLISVIILAIVIIGAVGVFLYGRFLESSIKSKEASLERARESFEPSLIENLIRLDRRIEDAKFVLSNHIAPSAIFALIENSTVSGVRFRNFSYKTGEEGVSIAMSGLAKSFSLVALQSDEFGNNPMFINPIVSDFSVESDGNVSFAFSSLIDPSVIAFKPNGERNNTVNTFTPTTTGNLPTGDTPTTSQDDVVDTPE